MTSSYSDQNLKKKFQNEIGKIESPSQFSNGEDNQKQYKSLGRLSTAILRGNPDEQFVPATSIAQKPQPSFPFANTFSEASQKEEKLSKVIKYIKEQKRTKHAAEFLIEQFSEFRFFKQVMRHLSQDLLQQIIFELKLETYKKHQVIFQYNDVGRHMYFILSGKVAILIPSKPNNISASEVNTPSSRTPVANENNPNPSSNSTNNPQIQQLQNQHSQIFQGANSVQASPRVQTALSPFSHALSIAHTSSKENNLVVSNFKDYLIKMVGLQQAENLSVEEEFEYFRQYKLSSYKQVNTVLAGNTFGEVALEQRIPRTASTVTMTPCQLATLSYDGFRKLLSKIYERIQNEQRSFLKEIPPFNNWPNSGIMVIYNNSEEVEYQINNIIYKEGDRCQYVYFIKEGEIDISKVFKIDKCDTNTLQKKNIVSKRQVIQRVAQGRMFGEFEGIFHLLDPKKKNSKQKEALPLRETQAVCQTKVKLMRIESRLFFLNFWAFNNPEDQEFFQVQRQSMIDKINKIENMISSFQTANIHNQEINELSDMLQTNSLLQQNHDIKKLMRGSTTVMTPKKYSICQNTPINILARNSDLINQNNSKSNETGSSDRTTLLGSPLTTASIKRSSSINFNLNFSPSSSACGSTGYLSYGNQQQPQLSPLLLQAAQQNQLLKAPSLFQRLSKIQNSIFEASSPIAGRGSDPIPNIDSFSSRTHNIQDINSPRRSLGNLQISTRRLMQHSTISQQFDHPNSPVINLQQQTPSQNNAPSGITQIEQQKNTNFPHKINMRLLDQEHQQLSTVHEKLDFNEPNQLSHFDGFLKEGHETSSNNVPVPSSLQSSMLQQTPSKRSLSNLNKDSSSAKQLSGFTQSKMNEIIPTQLVKHDTEQSMPKHAKKETQQLLLEQPLKIFQLKDSRKLKVLRKDIEDKFQQWRDQDNGKKLIRKKKSLSIKFNGQAAQIFNQIQSQILQKNQPQLDVRLVKHFQEGTRVNSPQTERQLIKKSYENSESNELYQPSPVSTTNLKSGGLHSEQKSSIFKSENPSEFINILRKSRRNPSAVFTSYQKQDQNEDNANQNQSSDKLNNSFQHTSPLRSPNELNSPSIRTIITQNLQRDALSPMKIISMTQEKQLLKHETPHNQLEHQQPYTNNNTNNTIRSIIPFHSPQPLRESKLFKTGSNFYKFQIAQIKQQEEQNTRRQIQSQQAQRNKGTTGSQKNIDIQEQTNSLMRDFNGHQQTEQQKIQEGGKTNAKFVTSMSVTNYENINFIQCTSKNHHPLNCQTSIMDMQPNITETTSPTLVNIQNIQTHAKKEQINQLQTFSHLDQSPLKVQIKKGHHIKSVSQPSILCSLPSSEYLASQSNIKEDKRQPVQTFVQPLQAMTAQNHIKKTKHYKNISSLEQASKLPPTIKAFPLENLKKFQKNLVISSHNNNHELINREIKQVYSSRSIDADQFIKFGHFLSSARQQK